MRFPLSPFFRAAVPALSLALSLPAFGLEKAPPPWGIPPVPQQGGNDRVTVMSDNYVAANEKIPGDLVTVMGNSTVDGAVGHDVVTVMGNVAINGAVGHNVVATMGSITLGPGARVDGDVVAACGAVRRAPGAVVRGRIVGGSQGRYSPRPPDAPGYGPRLPWVWNGWPGRFPSFRTVVSTMMVLSLAFCTLLALVFPRGIGRCGDALARRPGITVLAAFITLLSLPLIFVLLCLTILGIPAAVLLLPLAVLVAELFGKASIYGLIGRRIARDNVHPALAVLAGGVLCSLFCFNPILGLALSVFLSVLGLGCVVAALIPQARTVPVPSQVAAPAPPPIAGTQPPPQQQQETPEMSHPFPRAGFWIRMGALFIDALIIGSIFSDGVINHRIFQPGFHISGSNCLLPLAAYGAVMWKLKGTTIGGMIFGVSVVRLDGRPVDWETAIVRALGCCLSSILWLGFIWIAFDPGKQAWHDKIAGTIAVRTKGKSLV